MPDFIYLASQSPRRRQLLEQLGVRHQLLLASERPTLVSHFARHGYRTVGWMPGLKRPWPEGAFYGFDRLADDAGIGYHGPDFGYWRIPDHAAMRLAIDFSNSIVGGWTRS